MTVPKSPLPAISQVLEATKAARAVFGVPKTVDFGIETWTPNEESAFGQLMQVGHLERMPAIRLYRRCRCDLKKALAIATMEASTKAARIAQGKRMSASNAAKRLENGFIAVVRHTGASQANAEGNVR
jgi:hypothetical protein